MTSDRVAIVAADVLPLFWRYEFFLDCSLFLFCIITKHTGERGEKAVQQSGAYVPFSVCMFVMMCVVSV